MNTDQFQSMLRQILTAAGAVAITLGHADPTQVQTYGGAIGVVASVVWSLFAHKS